MRSMLLTAFLVLAAGPLRAAQDADNATGKPEAKPAKTAAKAPEAASTAPTKPEAAQEDRSPKSRTLKELIGIALEKGRDRELESSSAEKLGLKARIPTKAFRFKSRLAPDGREHAFHVLYQASNEKEIAPVGLVWMLTKISTKDGARHLDHGWGFRLSLDGLLEAAFKGEGKEGAVVQTIYPIDSPEVRNVYDHEKRFYLEESLQLEMSLR